MGGKSGGSTVIQPNTPAPPTAGQSAAEYAAALPSILQAQIQYQPQFNEADFQSFAKLAPLYTQVANNISQQLYPSTTGLQEQLASEASRNATATQIPDWMAQSYRNSVNSQLGQNVNSPIGADYVSRGLIDQAQQYRSYYQNLGLSLTGRQPLTQPQTQQPSFSVANQFGQNYSSQLGGYGSFVGANRPMLGQQGTPNWIPAMQAAGSAAMGAGMMMCWVASVCFGGWYKPKTVMARFYVTYFAPTWFRKIYVKHGEKISKWRGVNLLTPVFELFAYLGKRKMYGS